MKKGAIYIDSDGFFWPDSISADYMSEERRLISFDSERQSINSLFEQYYLGFRSSCFICEDKFENETDALEALRAYCEGCIGSAWGYVRKHIDSKLELPVDFMWITRMNMIDQLKDDYPEVENIHLRLSMKPRISARTVDKNTIIFPALVRTIVNHCNLVIINSSFRVIDEIEQSDGIDRREISRFILPYLLFCHDDFSVKNLPIIAAYSEDAIATALKFTNLQIMFIFAHEYAHILLRHFENNTANSKMNERIENEADSFALKVILGYIKKDDSYSDQDVFTAIRWLFKYQLIEECIGALIRGENLDFYKSTYEERRGEFQSQLINSRNLRSFYMLDIVGFMAIVELQNVLYEYGANLINDIINAFNKSDKTGGIEPWWEKITKR